MAKTNKVGKKGKQNRNAGKHPSYKKRGMSKEAIENKRKYDREYQRKRRAKLKRADANRKRREEQKKGNPKAKVGSKYDYDHKTGRMEKRSVNRGRKGEGGRKKGKRK